MNGKLNNVEWSFVQETGCLTITGTGKMQNWTEHQERPWEEIRDEIRRVRICTGLESVGDCAFQNCTSLEELELPEMLVYLGVYSFRGCTALKDVNCRKEYALSVRRRFIIVRHWRRSNCLPV